MPLSSNRKTITQASKSLHQRINLIKRITTSRREEMKVNSKNFDYAIDAYLLCIINCQSRHFIEFTTVDQNSMFQVVRWLLHFLFEHVDLLLFSCEHQVVPFVLVVLRFMKLTRSATFGCLRPFLNFFMFVLFNLLSFGSFPFPESITSYLVAILPRTSGNSIL